MKIVLKQSALFAKQIRRSITFANAVSREFTRALARRGGDKFAYQTNKGFQGGTLMAAQPKE